jgi:hypothetical protein
MYSSYYCDVSFWKFKIGKAKTDHIESNDIFKRDFPGFEFLDEDFVDEDRARTSR